METTLVFVDFTDATLNTIATAVAWSHKLQYPLHLVYVCPLDQGASGADDKSSSDLLMNERIKKDHARIQQLATSIERDESIGCTASCRRGPIAEELVAEAQAVEAGLIVMGIHSGSDLSAYRSSNDAFQVIKMTSCPVLTIPDTQKWTTFSTILFPVRPIPDSLAKYNFASRIIRQNRATVTLMALMPPDEIISREQLKDELAEMSAKLAQDEIPSQTLFCETDNLAETVLDQSRVLQANLVIITARLATTSDNFFIGPFTQQIIHNAQLPVLAIRPE